MRTCGTCLRATLGALLITFAVGCTGDGPTGPEGFTIADLAGTWTGDGFTVTSKADPSVKMDLVALGGTVGWSVTPNGTFSGTAVIPGEGFGFPGTITVPLSGVLRVVSETTLRVDFVPEIPPMFATFIGAFTLVDDVLTLDDDDESSFDFDQDGVQEPALLHVSFRRN